MERVELQRQRTYSTLGIRGSAAKVDRGQYALLFTSSAPTSPISSHALNLNAAMSNALSIDPRELKVLGLVGSSHMLSHVYILLLPPLFPLLREEFGVNYAALGVIAAAFSLASTLGQIPMGFLVDRIGGRSLLVAGLLLQGCAGAGMALADSYWMLVMMSGLAGLANTVFHPADFSILSASVPHDRLGRAFSVHSLSGNLGAAMTPPVVVALTTFWNWRVALAAAALLSVLVAMLVAWQRDALAEERAQPVDGEPTETSVREGVALLRSRPVLMAFMFFFLGSIGVTAIQTQGVAAIAVLNGSSLTAASGVLTAFLIGATAGIFVAAFLLDRVGRPDPIVIGAFTCGAALLAVVGSLPLSIVMLTALLAVTGVCTGIVQPSRDLMVRRITPEGSAGKVFGFLSTAFSIGGVVTPVIFGWILDHARASWMFWLIAAFMLAAILTVVRLDHLRPRPPSDSDPAT